MAHIKQVAEDEAAGAIGRLYKATGDRAGRVANIIKVMSLDGRSAQASMQLYMTLMKSPNALDAARREMLATVVSNVNECYY